MGVEIHGVKPDGSERRDRQLSSDDRCLQRLRSIPGRTTRQEGQQGDGNLSTMNQPNPTGVYTTPLTVAE